MAPLPKYKTIFLGNIGITLKGISLGINYQNIAIGKSLQTIKREITISCDIYYLAAGNNNRTGILF